MSYAKVCCVASGTFSSQTDSGGGFQLAWPSVEKIRPACPAIRNYWLGLATRSLRFSHEPYLYRSVSVVSSRTSWREAKQKQRDGESRRLARWVYDGAGGCRWVGKTAISVQKAQSWDSRCQPRVSTMSWMPMRHCAKTWRAERRRHYAARPARVLVARPRCQSLIQSAEAVTNQL